MKIEWNKVTWYSKLIAVILFVFTFLIGFNLGKKSEYVEPIVAPAKSWTVIQPINAVSYSCDGGKTINAKYYQGTSKASSSPNQPPVPGGSVELQLGDGRSMTLPQTMSADGARYANPNESFVFWSKGSGAFVTEGNLNNTTYSNCVTK